MRSKKIDLKIPVFPFEVSQFHIQLDSVLRSLEDQRFR